MWPFRKHRKKKEQSVGNEAPTQHTTTDNNVPTQPPLEFDQLIDRATRNDPTLTVFIFESKYLGDEGAKSIADALRQNTSITELNLGWNKIGVKGAKSIADALRQNTSITKLDLGGNQINTGLAERVNQLLDINKTSSNAKEAVQLKEALEVGTFVSETTCKAETEIRQEADCHIERGTQSTADEHPSSHKLMQSEVPPRSGATQLSPLDHAFLLQISATRAALDATIKECEDVIKSAQLDVEVETLLEAHKAPHDLDLFVEMLLKADKAKHDLDRLISLQAKRPSHMELKEQRTELLGKYDSARKAGAYVEAADYLRDLKKINKKIEHEVRAESELSILNHSDIEQIRDAIIKDLESSDIEWSRGAIKRNLESASPLSAANLSMSYLESCTESWSESNKIGSGGFADVYRGLDVTTGVAFAVKRFRVELLRGGTAQLINKSIETEIKTLSSLSHPNIIRLLGFSLSDEKCAYQCLVYELAAGGSLSQVFTSVEGRRVLNWRRRVRAGVSLVSAIRYLHSKDIYHRDIKPDNICFCEDMEKVVLIDYGIAKFVDSNTFHATLAGNDVVGSMGYMAPEYLANPSGLVPKSEVYSIGMVLAVLITGTHQMISPTRVAEIRNNSALLVDDADKEAGPWEEKSLKLLADYACECMAEDPKNRPEVDVLLEKLMKLYKACPDEITPDECKKIQSVLVASRVHAVRRNSETCSGTCSCGRDDVRGLVCRMKESPHFCCDYCFGEHLVEHLGDDTLRCREENCKSLPFTLDDLYNHASRAVFFKHITQQVERRVMVERIEAVHKGIREIKEDTQKGVSRLSKSLKCLSGGELECPKLLLLVPAKSKSGISDSAFRSMVKNVDSLVRKDYFLYFLCAFDKTPVRNPIIVKEAKSWVKKALPALKLSIMALNIVAQLHSIFSCNSCSRERF